MTITLGLTRQEVIRFAKITSNRLQYLERTGLVEPHRFGNPNKPTVIYTLEQVLAVLVIRSLRPEVSLEITCKVLELLQNPDSHKLLEDNQIVAIDDYCFWVSKDWSNLSTKLPNRLRGSDTIDQYTLTVIPNLDRALEKWKTLKEELEGQSMQIYVGE